MNRQHTTGRLTMAMAIAFLGMSLSACSNSSWVKGASLATETVNNNDYISLTTTLDTGSMTLIPISIPIQNPNNPSEQLGQLSIQTGMGTGAQLSLKVNLSSALNIPGSSSAGKLPNGTDIPVATPDANKWIQIPIRGQSSRIYLNLDTANKTAVMGVAVGISNLNVGVGANLLIPFNVSGVNGLAGVYSGTVAGQSGFALFADASSLLKTTNIGFGKLAMGDFSDAATGSVTFMPAAKNDNYLTYRLYHLNRKKSQLNMQ